MTTTMMLRRQPVYDRVEDLLDALAGGRAWRREPMGKSVDSLSGSPFERVVIDGRPDALVAKHIDRRLDWVMRVLGDGAGGTPPRALTMWREGLLAAMPAEIDPVVVGMAYDPAGGHLYQVMRDAGASLVPPDQPVTLSQHRRFLDHLAATHVAFWGFTDRFGLTTPPDRYGFAHPRKGEEEAAAGHDDPIPRMFAGGWRAVAEAAPDAARAALAIAADPTPFGRTMAAAGPVTLVHGDWKFGNLGSAPDGRTVLLDWAWPGEAPPAVDLAWYVAVNCDRLPESKEDTIEAYRVALARRGVDTGPWWQRQLDLALLGAFVQLGWSKAGDPAELAWWTDRVERTARTLGGPAE